MAVEYRTERVGDTIVIHWNGKIIPIYDEDRESEEFIPRLMSLGEQVLQQFGTWTQEEYDIQKALERAKGQNGNQDSVRV